MIVIFAVTVKFAISIAITLAVTPAVTGKLAHTWEWRLGNAGVLHERRGWH